MSDQLDLSKTFHAILDAAREKRFISYADLARANNAEWNKIRFKLNHHLGELVGIAAKKGWPILSSIVVSKSNVRTGTLEGRDRDGLIKAAKEHGFTVNDPAVFIEDQQRAMFAWAETASNELALFGDDPNSTYAPSNTIPRSLFDDPNRCFWFVGAMWDGREDQTERFFEGGVWQNGHHDKFKDEVARMKPGDRIAIKASFVRQYGLPFENQNKPVSCMRIKATGTVIASTKDGRTVMVDWQPLGEPREWYFYTYRVTVIEADTSSELARRLIQFAFNNKEQDYEFWLRQPHWASRYRAREPTATQIEMEIEEASADLDDSNVTPYAVNDILDDGCFLSSESLDAALFRLKEKNNLILQGPPGTGKTWLATRLGYALIGTNDRAVVRRRMRSIQFHPSLSYEDFVRGWRPDGDGKLSLIDGVFLEAVEAARAEPDRPYIVIIEEINRGNPAQIFGEMLTLLETDKRREEDAIELAYRHAQGERVYIPSNFFLIGTMNIADRSLALVDLALRRRFAFVTLETQLNDSWRRWCINQAGISETVLVQIQKLMAELNIEIAGDRSLGPQFMIGHSYVTPKPGKVIEDPKAWFQRVVETEIAPLLDEYWFDDLDRAATAKSRLLQGL